MGKRKKNDLILVIIRIVLPQDRVAVRVRLVFQCRTQENSVTVCVVPTAQHCVCFSRFLERII